MLIQVASDLHIEYLDDTKIDDLIKPEGDILIFSWRYR